MAGSAVCWQLPGAEQSLCWWRCSRSAAGRNDPLAASGQQALDLKGTAQMGSRGVDSPEGIEQERQRHASARSSR